MTKILVAEDDRSTRLLVKRILEREGYEVAESPDGGSAYNMAVEQKPDAIILDIWMPVLDGFDVLRRIQQNQATANIPVVLLTDLPVASGEPVGLRMGVKHYIPKPVDPGMITLAIRSALRDAETGGDEPFSNTFTNGKKSTSWGQQVIKIENDLLDMKLGGGIPLGSLTLIEGASSAGKSVLCQHFTNGSLRSGHGVAYFSFEETAKSLVVQMSSIGLEVSDYVNDGNFRIYPLQEPTESENPERFMDLLAKEIEGLPGKYSTIVVDSIANLAAYTSDRGIIGFFSACKRMCDEGRTIILVTHSTSFGEKMLNRIRGLCDVHLKLCLDRIGAKLVKTLEVNKIHNAELDTGSIICFEVLPGLGMRLSPIVKVSI